MTNTEKLNAPYYSREVVDGVEYVVDRRVVERRPDGSRLIRDPVTLKAYDPSTGEEIVPEPGAC